MYKCHKPLDRETNPSAINGNKLSLASLYFFLSVFRDCSSVFVCLYCTLTLLYFLHLVGKCTRSQCS